MTQPPGRSHLSAVPPAPEASVPPGAELALPTPPTSSAELEWAELPESMWQLPDVIAQSAFSEIHAQLVQGLRKDARHLPTGTLQAMQMERVAYYYTYIRFCDAHGWSSPREKTEVHKLWRDIASDFNSVVYGNKISPAQLHAIVSTHTAKIVASVLNSLPREQAMPLYQKFAAVLDPSADVG